MQRILLLAVLCALLVSPSAAHASATGVVISQIYGGGGNSTSAFQNDFVELFNTGTTAVDISGWTVQYATAAGTSWQTTALSGTISAGHYYLVQLASSASTGAPLPTPDATGTTNVAATSGKVAVVRGTTAIACGASAGSCSADALVEDLVGYGGAGDFEGTGSAPAASNALSAQRASAGCVDTGDNAADFTSAAPTPRNSSSPAESCAGTPGSGAGGSVRVDVDVASSLSISLDRSSVSFGATSSGATPTPLAVNATVSSNNVGGYALTVARTAFSPNDLPLGIAANAPGGATLAAALAGGALVPVPAQPGPAFVIGTRATPSAATGDIWPTRIGFSSPLPLVGAGRYTATVTYTATAK
ncbi:MAG: lamin tail domain-containing protein [Gaiellaceae bacterium]